MNNLIIILLMRLNKNINFKDHNSEIEVFGSTWSNENIKENYHSLTNLDSFLNYALSTSGEWLLVDYNKKILITSPGFTGGYCDSENLLFNTKVKHLITDRRKNNQPLLNIPSTLRYISYDNKDGTYSFPVQTPFEGIRFIGGGIIIEFKEELLVRTYLNKINNKNSNLSDALNQTATQAKKDVTLLFSGGKDSLAIYAALKNYSSTDLKVVYIDQDGLVSGGRLQIAREVAKKCNIPLEVISPKGGWAFGDKSKSETLDFLLKETLVYPLMPFHCLDDNESNRLVVDGQNMDSMLSLGMPKPPQRYPGFIKLKWWLIYFKGYIPRTLRYSNAYNKQKFFRLGLSILTQLMDRKIDLEELKRSFSNYTDEEILASYMLGLPPNPGKNILSLSNKEVAQEVKSIESLFNDDINVRTAWFYMYPLLASVYGGAGNNNIVAHYVNQGPFAGLWQKPISIKTAMKPKNDINKYVQKNLGISYDDIVSNKSRDELLVQPDFSCFDLYLKYFDVSNSYIASHLEGNELTEFSDTLNKLKTFIIGFMKNNNRTEKMTKYDVQGFAQAFRYLNIELLVRNN